ncbi:MAG: glycosyltransferase family 39 protein [Tsuneonella sp.]
MQDGAAWLGAIAVFAGHAALAGRYDLFRDELYFIVCGQHPAFGYVDQPPLVPLLAAALHAVAPGPWLLRLPAALASGLLVLVTVRLTRRVGGGRLAVALAGTAVAIAPILMGITAILNTTAFDPLVWTLIALLFVRAVREEDGRALIWLGALVGLARSSAWRSRSSIRCCCGGPVSPWASWRRRSARCYGGDRYGPASRLAQR